MKTHFISFLSGSFVLLALTQTGHAQPGGTVHFGNDSSCRLTNGQTASPVTLTNNVKAALYWAPLGTNTFSQIGASVNVGNPLPGIFSGGTRTNDEGTIAGDVGQFQVRSWAGGFTNYEQAAMFPGTLLGESAVLTITTGNPVGDPPTPPASLVGAGLLGFTLTPSTAAPLVLTCATNKTVDCGSAWIFDAPTTSGGCSNVMVGVFSTVTNGTCPEIITRTWLATDSCDASNVCSQTVTVIDATPPIISCASNKIVECGSAWTFDAPTGSDGCSGTNVSISILSTLTNGLCPQTTSRTWLAVDACGNTNTCSQTVTIVDATPPVLTCATNKTVSCGSIWTFDPPTATDDCAGTNVIISVLLTVTNGACPQTATRTWIATDTCGNSNICSQVVSIVDTTPPTLACATNKTVACGNVWAFDEPAVSDDCSTNIVVSVFETTTNGICPLIITRTWLAADACGNTNTCSQVVTVIDLTSPTVSCSTNKNVDCTNSWSFDLPTAGGGCLGTNVSVAVLSTTTNSLCPLTLTRVWEIANVCNSNTVTCSQTVVVRCSDCPMLALTKQCPPYPVPPGGILNYSGTVTNISDVTLTNIIVVNNQPAPNTVVFGPATLAPGDGATFSASYSVGVCGCAAKTDTLTATGVTLNGDAYTNTLTTSCATATVVTPGDTNGDGIVDQSELNAVLANYWGNSQWIYMTNPATLGGGNFQFALTNASAWNFTVLVTTNFADWTNLPGPANPVYQFHDPDATNAPQRYYRLQWP